MKHPVRVGRSLSRVVASCVVLVQLAWMGVVCASDSSRPRAEGRDVRVREQVVNRTRGMRIGKIQQHGNLAIAPILGTSGSSQYLTLKEALGRGLGVIDQRDVNSIHFRNRTGKKVLAIVGEIVVGQSQNRNLTRNIIFAEDFDARAPVNCAQHGRSTGDGTTFNVYGGIAPTSVSSRRQHEAWTTIRNHLDDTHVPSQTEDLTQIYESKRPDFAQRLSHFSVLADQIGFVVSFWRQSKRMFSLDIFDQASTFRKYFSDRVQGYVLDSGLASREKASMTEGEARVFLSQLDRSTFKPITPVSQGNDYKIIGEHDVRGSAIAHGDQTLYTNLFNGYDDPRAEQQFSGQEILSQQTMVFPRRIPQGEP